MRIESECSSLGYVKYIELKEGDEFRFAYDVSYHAHLNYLGKWNKKLNDIWCVCGRMR
jgi:hypothetical protein